MESAFLQIDGVSKSFGPVRAVENVSFSSQKGELVAVLGPSGCGKTTLLRIVAGFEEPDRGDVRVAEETITRRPPQSRGVGLLFQNYALFPHMTVAENIGYGLRYQRNAEKGLTERRVQQLLELVNLPGYQDRRPDQLSAGQQQRVAIARALAPRPRLLLLDEPLSALDVSLRDHLRLNIRRIQRELALTTLYVTHDQEEALSISDRIVVMQAGRIEQFGTPRQVYERPRTAFVASFFGRTALLPTSLFPKGIRYLTGSNQAGTSVVLRADQVHTEGPGLSLTGRLSEVEYLGDVARLQVDGVFGRVWATAPGTEVDTWRGRISEEVTVYFNPEESATVQTPS